MAANSHAAEVQAELQQYLNSKNINSLFIAIVENLLIEKPSNPMAFIIEYLHRLYPEQCIDAILKIAAANGGVIQSLPPQSVKNKLSSKGSFTGEQSSSKLRRDPSDPIPIPSSTKSVNLQAKSSAGQLRSEGKDNGPSVVFIDREREPLDSEDEEGDTLSEVPEVPSNQSSAHRQSTRRRSVSAESTDPDKLLAQMSHIARIEKSREVTEELLSVVNKSLLLRTLDNDQKDMIVGAFAGPFTKNAGEDIIRQGDIGDEFYLLEDGLVDVYVKRQDSPEVRVHTYRPGDSFGELAILYNTPRAATCRAQVDCKVWALDRISFKAIVVAAAMQKRDMYQSFLQQVPILQSLSPLEVMTLADCLAEERFEDGDTICREGDKGDYFYIIRDGKAICWQSDKEGNGGEGVVGELFRGNYFGEIALLTTKPRQATVKASGSLSVLAIDRATFTRVLGSMEDILKRSMTEYIKYTSSQ